MRERLLRFMAGRNGNDQLNLFLYAVDAALLLLGLLLPGRAGQGSTLAMLLLLGVIYFRALSRDRARRSSENAKYLRLRFRVLNAVRLRREKWVQRKDYKFFTCPSCKTTLRVPRGHGKIRIVCKCCGNSFEGKT